MSRLKSRIADLEQRLTPMPPMAWVRILQQPGQGEEQAIAAWEADNGPANGRNFIMRVIVDGPSLSTGAPYTL